MLKSLVVGIALFIQALPALASSPRLLHQTSGSIMVRMGADDRFVVWQEVGNNGEEKLLYGLDTANGRKFEIKAPKRPFGPAVAGGWLFYGAGHLNESIDVMLTSLTGDKTLRLHKLVPWIVEPALQVRGNRLQAVWERPQNTDGDGMAIYLYDADAATGKGGIKILADGPVLRRDEIPREYFRFVRNEYPEISGDSVVFQNNEYGTPNIYRLEMATGKFTRLSPSGRHQERPAIDGPLTAWEESESGFSSSQSSAIFVHDARTGKVRKVNAEAGFHYQVRVHGDYVIYGAKREPLEHTPSIRVHDYASGKELQVQNCFPGPIYDWAAVDKGLYVAQRVGQASSRLLFASWAQLRNECQR